MTTETQVVPYRMDYKCDMCNEGFMRPGEFVYASNPPQYPHVCTCCGERKTFWDVRYPYITYKTVEESKPERGPMPGSDPLPKPQKRS